METQRIVEFPHRIVDDRPRKRPRLTWDGSPPLPSSKILPTIYGQEFGNGGIPTNFWFSSIFYRGLPRHGSPPWRPNDKDGHYVFAIGDNLTPRFLECFNNGKTEVVAIKFFLSIHKYREAAMIEIDVLQRLARHDVGGTLCVQIQNCFDYCNHVCIVFGKLEPSLYDFLCKNSYRSFPIDLVQFVGLFIFAVMHNLRLIHTDLWPENILLVSSEYINLPDYKALDETILVIYGALVAYLLNVFSCGSLFDYFLQGLLQCDGSRPGKH